MKKEKVIIIGAGPGGLASAMILAKRGFEVEVFEKLPEPGGRTSEIRLGDYRFDVGPTFFMFKEILDNVFKATGEKPEDYLKFLRLAPAYRLVYPDNRYMDIYDDHDKMKKELKRVFEGDEKGLDKFLQKEKIVLSI